MPRTGLPSPESNRLPHWRREYNRYALALVLLIHLAFLASLLLSSTQQPARLETETLRTEVVVYLPKLPKKEIPVPQPMPGGVKAAIPIVAPPPPKAPERKAAATLPKLDFAPDAIQLPVSEPLANLAMIDVVASKPGSGGAGTAGGAGSGGGGGAGSGMGSGGNAKLFEECADTPDRQMVADVYRLDNDIRSVKEMGWRKPVKRVCLAQLDITPRSFRDGFPGMGRMVEWFGLDIRFTVDVAEAGTWVMLLVSDDGAILSIDGQDVIDNDGEHEPRLVMVKVKLKKGVRHFRVRYFQGPRENIALVLAWKKPDADAFSYLPRHLLGRPPETTNYGAP
jgi:hypothetical protein